MSFNPCDPNSRAVVLLVDDDHNDQALFALAVEQTNAPLSVHNVLDGQQAIDYLEGKSTFADRALHPLPDLILLDLKMDLGDGFDFLSWREKNRKFSALPVILFTGSQYEHDIQRALHMGATAHVPKPLAFKELIAAVNQIRELGKELGVRALQQHAHTQVASP